MRYLRASLLGGFITFLLISGLMASGAFASLDLALWGFLGKNASEPSTASFAQYFLILLLSVGVSWIMIDVSQRIWKAMIIGALLLEVLFLPLIAYAHGWFFSPFGPALAILFSSAGGWAYSRTEAGQRKRLLSQLFGERISRKVFYSLLDSKEPLDFSGKKRNVSVLLCEIVNQDELTDNLPTSDYVVMTNLFLQLGSEYLVNQGALLDECDGESLRVVFGAPMPDEHHAEKACEAALGLGKCLADLNRTCEQRWHKRFDFRIAVNSGPVVLAAYGSPRLGTFTAAGEPVEFARRLCTANLIYGSRILIGSGTLQQAINEIEVRPMELTRSGDEIYELLGSKHSLSDEELFRRDLFWNGVILFREGKWEASLELFKAALPPGSADVSEYGEGDRPLQFYIHRVEQVRAGMPALHWQDLPGSSL